MLIKLIKTNILFILLISALVTVAGTKNFDNKKSKEIVKLNKEITIMKAHRDCISNAQDKARLKTCKKVAKEQRKAERERRRAERKANKQKRKIERERRKLEKRTNKDGRAGKDGEDGKDGTFTFF